MVGNLHILVTTHIARLLVVLIGTCSPLTGGAAVTGIHVESRTLVMDGNSFGAAGAYEKITGRVELAFDPRNHANARIVDLQKAPRNDRGLVEASANFMVLRPAVASRRSGVALLEVSNRGRKAALAYFNDADFALDPEDSSHFGDGFLLKRGLTLIWIGWQFDIPARDHLLRLEAPVAAEPDGPIRGLVRSDWTINHSASVLSLGHRGQIPYPVRDPGHAENVLTVRDGRQAPRRVVPRDHWQFARLVAGQSKTDRRFLTMPAGFQAGRIYELVYVAEKPVVVGLGLATVRDVAAHAKYTGDSPFAAAHIIAFGVSQTGRFLRHFLYQGFNTDERDRKVFDGMLIHTAGAGRGSFNHRFAQPSRDAHRYSAFFYPTDLFPFTGRIQRDPVTTRSDGLLDAHGRHDHLPKIFYTNTGYEYWGRAASLIHTTVDAKADLDPLANERIYHLAGGQHFVAPFPPSPSSKLPGAMAYRGNPLDFLITLRALLVRLQAWVAANRLPPASAYPRIVDGTLVTVDALSFPNIPGLSVPRVAHTAHRVDYGPRWEEGIISRQPPTVGRAFPTLVPQVDSVGNELGGIRGVELMAPLATYVPWSLRLGYSGPEDELLDFFGTYVPLAIDSEERARTGDPRPAITERYASKSEYLLEAKKAARELAADGFLLREDVDRALVRAQASWDWIMTRHPRQ